MITWRRERRTTFLTGEEITESTAPALIVAIALALAAVLIAVSLVVFGAVRVDAHPGRLDERGCHEVRRDFQYSDGRVARQGTRHCHRVLGIGDGVTLDGTESLQDGRHDHDDEPDEHTDDGQGS